jgi:hypothetical protein
MLSVRIPLAIWFKENSNSSKIRWKSFEKSLKKKTFILGLPERNGQKATTAI